MKYTFLSKWTVLFMTVIAVVVGFLGFGQLTGHALSLTFPTNIGLGILAFVVAFVVYGIAWVIALFDSVQERRWGWTIGLLLLLVTGLGPLLYSLFGPKNTK